MPEPAQKPGESVQEVGTPIEFLDAVQVEFRVARWTWDLAANHDNAVCDDYFGPDSRYGEDSLTATWPRHGELWLNPPFGNITPFAAKCVAYSGNARIFLLVPANTGAHWYRDNVFGHAHAVNLSPRIQFVGHKQGFPKDFVLAIFSNVRGGFSQWRWK